MGANDTGSLWSKFYHTLNCEAAKLRGMMKEAGIDATLERDADSGSVRADHNGQQRHSTKKHGGGETGD